MNYTVYHCHTDLSNAIAGVDSISKVDDYAKKANELGMSSLAISEHGNILNWRHKKDVIESYGLKYIHACEFYITENKDGEDKYRDNYHMVLIARNWDGVKEINKLTTASFNRDDFHYYYAPRISVDELMNTSDNIIITSACLGSPLNRGSDALKKKLLKFFADNKHRCFLEIQHHDSDEQREYNKWLHKASNKIGVSLIAGTDTHALDDDSASARKLLQKAKGIEYDDAAEFDLTFKSYEELVEAYRKQDALPIEVVFEAIENTNRMADMIEPFEIDTSYKYPKLYDNSEEVLKEKLKQGLKEKGIDKLPNKQEYLDRIAYELEAIRRNGAIDFLLLEEWYKREMRGRGVIPGYSRGSVSGSVICYLLGITDIDAVYHNTNFDRFMNTARVSLADIDTDWTPNERAIVKDFLYEQDNLYCCDVVTFNSLQLKAAIKEVARALDIPYEEVNNITKDLDGNEDKYKEKYPELFEKASKLVGVTISIGVHPSALVVSPIQIIDELGLITTADNDYPISSVNMKEIDGSNFVKLDILGLDNIEIINKTCKLAGIERLTPQNVPDDEDVWRSIREDTTEIFQFSSSFASDYISRLMSDETIKKFKEFNPNFSYIELASLCTAALRPAGDSFRDELAQGIVRDNGHEALNELLASSCGCLIYQCQILSFLSQFCGYTMGEADVVRRSFAKKTGTEKHIPDIKKGFIKTMGEKYGTPKDEAEKIVSNFLIVIEDASRYLFSYNHALPYSYISYILGYLRYYYPYEFLTVALNVADGDLEKINKLSKYAKKVGIHIKPIEFGKSIAEYSFDKANKSIYKGMSSIKYMNDTIPNELLELSKQELHDFVDVLVALKDTSVNSRQLDILIRLNFFARFGKSKYLLALVELFKKLGKCKTIKKEKLYTPELFNLTESQVREFAGKETAKQFGEIDNIGLIKSLAKSIKNEALSLRAQVEAQYEYLGYCDFASDKVPEYYWLVTEFKTYKDKNRPYVTLHNLHSGDEVKTRIKYGKTFKANPFEKFDVLCFEKLVDVPKVRKDSDGNWIETGEMEQILNVYEVVRK